jgi:hypothetical protein
MGAYTFQTMWSDIQGNKEQFNGFLAELASCADDYLHDYWQGILDGIRKRARATSLVQPHGGVNFARSSQPTQSSVSPWSKGKTVEEDAQGAISGVISGADGFHTNHEPMPWWMTDLGETRRINEVRVFNSLKNPGMASRAYPLVIETSIDGSVWQRLFFNEGNSPFGGADGHPLIVRAGREARYVKLSLTTADYFHLDEIEIYGQPEGR